MLARTICQNHNYVFVQLCDAGAFKKTFHVRDSNGTDLALKLLIKAGNADRVQREIAAHQACRHPHISHLIDVGNIDHQGQPLVYFVEEFLSGGTLGARLNRGALTRVDGKQVAIAITEALAHLEPQGIVHRDIKPENIMHRADGSPVLVDLGIARHLNQTSLTQTWIPHGPGTPIFASPEQLVNDKYIIDWRADQYSLGITLSIGMLCVHPYEGGGASDTEIVERMSRREMPQQGFIDAAKAQRLELLIKMVDPWPIRRFARPEYLLDAWKAV